MSQAKPSVQQTDELIRAVLRDEHPSTVGELWSAFNAKYNVNELSFIETVKSMVGQNTLRLASPKYRFESFLDYLFSLSQAGWLWATFTAVFLAVLAVAMIPSSSLLAPIRWAFGSILSLYLPGYVLLRLLFVGGSEFDALERFALTLGASLAVVPLIGFALNFSPWGIRFEPIIASLALFVSCFAAGAAAREYLKAARNET